MKIIILILMLVLGALPASAGVFSTPDSFVQLALSQEGGRKKSPSSGKVVIRGKGGKVTGIVQQPDGKKKDGKKTK